LIEQLLLTSYFNDRHVNRQEGSELAGFTVERIINEPTAAPWLMPDRLKTLQRLRL